MSNNPASDHVSPSTADDDEGRTRLALLAAHDALTPYIPSWRARTAVADVVAAHVISDGRPERWRSLLDFEWSRAQTVAAVLAELPAARARAVGMAQSVEIAVAAAAHALWDDHTGFDPDATSTPACRDEEGR